MSNRTRAGLILFIASILMFALLSLLGRIVWISGREAYSSVAYGLPLGWLEVSRPNRAVALTHPDTLYRFNGFAAAVDLAVAVVLGVAASSIILGVRRRTLESGGEPRCRCGYILRGLTSNRCPECGTPFAASTCANDDADDAGRA